MPPVPGLNLAGPGAPIVTALVDAGQKVLKNPQSPWVHNTVFKNVFGSILDIINWVGNSDSESLSMAEKRELGSRLSVVKAACAYVGADYAFEDRDTLMAQDLTRGSARAMLKAQCSTLQAANETFRSETSEAIAADAANPSGGAVKGVFQAANLRLAQTGSTRVFSDMATGFGQFDEPTMTLEANARARAIGSSVRPNMITAMRALLKKPTVSDCSRVYGTNFDVKVLTVRAVGGTTVGASSFPIEALGTSAAFFAAVDAYASTPSSMSWSGVATGGWKSLVGVPSLGITPLASNIPMMYVDARYATRSNATSYTLGGEGVFRLSVTCDGPAVVTAATMNCIIAIGTMPIKPSSFGNIVSSNFSYSNINFTQIYTDTLKLDEKHLIGAADDEDYWPSFEMSTFFNYAEVVNGDQSVVAFLIPDPTSLIITTSSGTSPTTAGGADCSWSHVVRKAAGTVGSVFFEDAKTFGEISVSQFPLDGYEGNVSAPIWDPISSRYVWGEITGPLLSYAGRLHKYRGWDNSLGKYTNAIRTCTAADAMATLAPPPSSYRLAVDAYAAATNRQMPINWDDNLFAPATIVVDGVTLTPGKAWSLFVDFVERERFTSAVR